MAYTEPQSRKTSALLAPKAMGTRISVQSSNADHMFNTGNSRISLSQTTDKSSQFHHFDLTFYDDENDTFILAPSSCLSSITDLSAEPTRKKEATKIQLSAPATDDLDLLTGISCNSVYEFAAFFLTSPGYRQLTSTSVELLAQGPDSEVYTHSSQLSPQAVPYEQYSAHTKRALGRQSVIQEIIDTEENYISSLKMLSGMYLETLINRGSNGIPVRATHSYVNMMISTHEEFLTDLRALFSISTRFPPTDNDAPSPGSGFLSCSSPLMATLVAELISKRAISVHIYQEYNSMQDLLLKLLASKKDDPELGAALTKSYQNFLESSQNGNMKMDLSFASLLSKPVSRIPKYKLFLEALSKYTPAEEDEICHQKIKDCLIQVDYSIMEVNRYGLQEKIKTNILFSSLVFSGMTTLKFPVEYLGPPLLSGALYTSWVEGRECMVTSQIFGAFLFKTHLIMANISKSNKFEVKFLIPLAVCKVVNSDDIEGGMTCQYEHSFKLIFEHNFRLFEVLLLANDEIEYSIWREKMEILTNVVNGPYKLDYSSSKFNEELGTNSSTIMPPSTQAVDAKPDRLLSITSSPKKHRHHQIDDKCYFRKIISVKPEFIEEPTSGSFSSVRFRQHVLQLENGTVFLGRVERAKVESLLEDLWSDELSSPEYLIRREKSHTFSRRRKRSASTLNSQGTSSHRSLVRKVIDKLSDDDDVPQVYKKTSLRRKTSAMVSHALQSLFMTPEKSRM